MKLSFSLLFSSLMLGAAQGASLLDVVASTDSLSTLAEGASLGGFGDFLNTTQNLTVFAPNNDAFAVVPPKFLEPSYIVHLRVIVGYHVVVGSVITASMVTDGAVVATSIEEAITASVVDGAVSFSGTGFEDANVVTADVMADNGVAHIVDKVFIPGQLNRNLLDLASAFEQFGNVVELIAVAGVEDDVRAEGRTIFAPGDEAFEALPQEFLASVAQDTELLSRLLKYHIIIGVYPKESFVDGMTMETVAGPSISVSVIGAGKFKQITFVGVKGDEIMYDIGDLIASNGIAHSIGGVFEAPDPEPTEAATEAPVAAPTEESTDDDAPVAAPTSSASSVASSVLSSAFALLF